MGKVERDTAKKAGKGQTGLECLAEKLASSEFMVSDYRRVSKGSSRSGPF